MKTLSVALTLLLSGAAVASQAQDAKLAAPQEASVNEAAAIQAQIPTYPLDTCLVSEEPLTAMGEPLDYLHEGRLVRFCCKGCIKMFKKDPKKVLGQIDAAVVKAQKSSYPLETCPISGEKLGAMGDPIEYVHGTRLVRFCCKGCIKAFKKAPEKTMAKIDAAYVAQQVKSYPLEACPISGKELGAMGDPIDYLYGTRLVRFCCKGCVKPFHKDPKATLAKIDAAAKKKG